METFCLGTIINAVLIIAGGLCGLLFGKAIREDWRRSIDLATGVSVLFIGMAGAMSGMLSIDGGKLTSGQSMTVVVSLVLGMMIGELLGIEKWFEHLGILP